MYSNGDLCLYLPGQWKESMLLADTILPWTSQWLLYYELWLITGHWMGTGHDHPAADPASLPRDLEIGHKSAEGSARPFGHGPAGHDRPDGPAPRRPGATAALVT